MKKIMILCSLLLLIFLNLFAINRGLKFEIFPKGSDVLTYLIISSSTFILYSLNKKKGLYHTFLTGCIIGLNGIFKSGAVNGGSLEKILHTLGIISLLILVVSFISLKKVRDYLNEK